MSKFLTRLLPFQTKVSLWKVGSNTKRNPSCLIITSACTLQLDWLFYLLAVGDPPLNRVGKCNLYLVLVDASEYGYRNGDRASTP